MHPRPQRVWVWGLVIGVGIIVSAPPAAQAAMSGVTFGKSGTMSGKVMRGLLNVATGVLEIPRQAWVYALQERQQGTNPLTALIDGMVLGGLKGAFSALGRMGSGAYDVLTFPIDYPKGFGALYNPETVFEAPWAP